MGDGPDRAGGAGGHRGGHVEGGARALLPSDHRALLRRLPHGRGDAPRAPRPPGRRRAGDVGGTIAGAVVRRDPGGVGLPVDVDVEHRVHGGPAAHRAGGDGAAGEQGVHPRRRAGAGVRRDDRRRRQRGRHARESDRHRVPPRLRGAGHRLRGVVRLRPADGRSLRARPGGLPLVADGRGSRRGTLRPGPVGGAPGVRARAPADEGAVDGRGGVRGRDGGLAHAELARSEHRHRGVGGGGRAGAAREAPERRPRSDRVGRPHHLRRRHRPGGVHGPVGHVGLDRDAARRAWRRCRRSSPWRAWPSSRWR